MLLIALKLVHGRRSRSHKTHISPKDIKKLRKFVYTRFPDKLSYLRNSRVVLHLKHEPIHLILLHELLLPLLRVHIHGTKLINRKLPAVFPNAGLLKNSRSRRLQLNGRNDEESD